MTARPPFAVVFDLDGTLIDSAPDVAAALNRLLIDEGRRALTLAEVQELVGEGAGALIERAWRATGKATTPEAVMPLVRRYLDYYRASPADHTIVYEDVAEVLDSFRRRGVPMGICTNKPQGMSDLVLDRLGLAPYFAAVLGGEYSRRKPDGDHIRETLRRMGAEQVQAVMVGDSATDVAAARDAGLPVIAVDWGYARMAPQALAADVLISRFIELPAAVESLCP
ncbi:MAG: phosphoglycolate phosphatase [Magnetospirillum sp.]|nr:phosphoglycolate phosphatase [Magnetospirillum sp.]